MDVWTSDAKGKNGRRVPKRVNGTLVIVNLLEQRTLDALVRLSESREHSERCMFVFPTNLMVASLSQSDLGDADLITDDVVTMVCSCADPAAKAA